MNNGNITTGSGIWKLKRKETSCVRKFCVGAKTGTMEDDGGENVTILLLSGPLTQTYDDGSKL